MEKAILTARDGKILGVSIAQPLSKEPLLPKLLIKFIAIGEKTGEMSEALRSISRQYQRDVDDTTNNMEAYIQPAFLMIITGMVIVIALAVYLPYSSVGDAVSPY